MNNKENIVPINKNEFIHARFKKFEHYGHAISDSVMPIVLAELNAAIIDMPIGIMQGTHAYELFAISSFIPNINVLIDASGNFKTAYIPACYRVYPFLVANIGEDKKILCFNNASGLLNTQSNEGEPFFDSDGNLSTHIENIKDVIEHIIRSAEDTQRALKLLDEMNLIVPWDIVINITGENQKVEGVFEIDGEKLSKLDGDKLIQLRDSGALYLIYAQMFSKQHIRKIEQLTRFYLMEQAKKQSNTSIVNQKGDLDLEFLNKSDVLPV